MRLGLSLFLTGMIPGTAWSADFKRDIAPILKKHCYECHSEETGKKKNGYVFDDLETLAGDIRPGGMIEPGEPETSVLIELLTLPSGDKRRMPPKGDGLSEKELKLVKEWIRDGAKLEKAVAVKPSGLQPRDPAKPAAAEVPEKWVSADGKIISAVFLSLDDDVVSLRMKGQNYRVPLEKLSEESRKLAEKRKSEAGKGAEKKETAGEK